jgi:hypothetical protein
MAIGALVEKLAGVNRHFQILGKAARGTGEV